MIPAFGRTVALAAVGLAFASTVPTQAESSSSSTLQSCRGATSLVLHKTPGYSATASKWSIVRVWVDKNGLVADKHVVYHSGDAAFDSTSLRAVTATAFTPATASCLAMPSTFDYALVSRHGKLAAAIMPPLTPGVTMRGLVKSTDVIASR